MENEDVSSVLYEIELAEKAFKKQNVSKMWWRALVALGDWFMKYGLWLGIMSFILYFLASSMLNDGGM